ncbi:MAG: heme lyase CcmF/NrfE family subunit [Phycisphaeraceae bacterium]
MTDQMGEFALSTAVLAAGGTVVALLAYLRLNWHVGLRVARGLTVLFAGMIMLAGVCLLAAFLGNDFRLDYVTRYSEKALPFGYKIAAFWAGQEGSLLLWACILAVLSAMVVAIYRKRDGVEPAVTLMVMAIVTGFFAAIMVFAKGANPFALLGYAVADGQGLNPMLQDPGMIAHPPLLFLGYAGYTVPFAILAGALAAGRRDDGWLADTRRWLLASWLFLSVGIILGAQWAYVELGWGGYWAWDPVENASLLPWLTGTALMHSIMIRSAPGKPTFRIWNAALIAATFLLCIFGTYLTRSGVIQSVHAFPESSIGQFFLTFIVVTLLVSVALIAWRYQLLRSRKPLDGFFTREGAFLATNILLVIITLTTLVGTVFPILSGLVARQPISVGPEFYNRVVAPMAVLLLAIMAIGPFLGYTRTGMSKLPHPVLIPVVAAIVGVGIAGAMGLTGIWALVCVAIIVFALVALVGDLVRLTVQRMREHGENLLAALIGQIDANHRRYGGQIVHLGMLMILAGVAGSSLFGQTHEIKMETGNTTEVAGYQVMVSNVQEVRGPNFTAVEAQVQLTSPDGAVKQLSPQVRFYDKSRQQANTEVSMDTSLRRDVYLSLAGWEQHGDHADVALKLLVNPLVVWIWIGGIVLTAGALLGLLPRILPHAAAATATADVQLTPAHVRPLADLRTAREADRKTRPKGPPARLASANR